MQDQGPPWRCKAALLHAHRVFDRKPLPLAHLPAGHHFNTGAEYCFGDRQSERFHFAVRNRVPISGFVVRLLPMRIVESSQLHAVIPAPYTRGRSRQTARDGRCALPVRGAGAKFGGALRESGYSVFTNQERQCLQATWVSNHPS